MHCYVNESVEGGYPEKRQCQEISDMFQDQMAMSKNQPESERKQYQKSHNPSKVSKGYRRDYFCNSSAEDKVARPEQGTH
jgi:hypothetical protein